MSNAGHLESMESMESRVPACERWTRVMATGGESPVLQECSAISRVKRRLWLMLAHGECTGRVNAASLCYYHFTLEPYISAINISWENFFS